MAKSARFAYAYYMSEREDWLQEGVAALRAGDRREALRLLGRAVNENPDNVAAWWFLSAVLTDTRQKMHALRQVLRLRPDHAEARELLKRLQGRQPAVSPPPPGSTAVARPAPARREVPRPPAAAPKPSLKRRGCWVALGMLGMLGLLVIAGVVVLLLTGMGAEFADLVAPESAPSGRLLVMSVPVCEPAPDGGGVLVFRNETGVTLDVLGGPSGAEQHLLTLAADSEGEAAAEPGTRVRYTVRSSAPGVRGSAAAYEVPPGSMCRVTVR